jgi:hypothetical protein
MPLQSLPLSIFVFGQGDIFLGMDWTAKHAAAIDAVARTCALSLKRRIAMLAVASLPGTAVSVTSAVSV